MQSKRLKLKRVRHRKRRLLYMVSKRIMAVYKREVNKVDPDKMTFSYDYMLRVKASLQVFMPNSKIWNEWCKRNNPPKPIYLDEYKHLL